jgi:hypothetical protein
MQHEADQAAHRDRPMLARAPSSRQEPMDRTIPPQPRISVIMATYNGQAYIRQAIASVLTQTMTGFELIIVDDCSTDETPHILSEITDPRVRILRNAANIGVVESRNRAFAEARCDYTAMLDHDDLCLPTRLEKQAAYLDNHPGTVLIGTAAHTMEAGLMGRPKHEGPTSPALIGWLLLVANPLVCSSVMFRTAAARALPCFMRTEYAYADDFDLYQRLAAFGQIARVDEPLTIYRLHGTNASRKHEDIMSAGAARALLPAYRRWLPEEDAEEAAALITRHIATGKPAPSIDTLRKIRHTLTLLTERYLAETDMAAAEAETIRGHAEMIWRRTVAGSSSMRGSATPADFASLFGKVPETWRQRLTRGLNRFPLERTARAAARRVLTRTPSLHQAKPAQIAGRTYRPAPRNPEDPPALFVVADIACGRAASLADDSLIAQGQGLFDQYGLRPIYLMDDAAAGDSALVARIAAIQDRHGCAVGGVLHADETALPERLTALPGCLAAQTDPVRLDALTAALANAFGVQPAFFRAGRSAMRVDTAALVQGRGYRVDFSIRPGADLRARGGPDYRPLSACAYWVEGLGRFLTMPVTSGGAANAPWLRPGGAAIALNPEIATAADQIRLIKSLLRTGTREFVVHYHGVARSPAAAPAAEIAARLEAVCRFFFVEAGGVPGFPDDLLARAAAAPMH